MSELEPNAETAKGGASADPAWSTFDPGPSLPPPPAPRRSRRGLFIFGALSGCLLLLLAVGFLGLVAALGSGSSSGMSLSTRRIAVVPVEGEILDSRETIELLHKYAESATVRGIVVRINSPGGAIAPSQEIFRAIRGIREESGKPIVASLDSVAASGGFYIAAACERIVANPGSITGSIGVILQWVEVKDLMSWAKMKPQTITSGTLKATGSPFKDLTEEERVYLTAVVNQLHDQFVRAVAEGRKEKLTVAEVNRLADGRIFTGEQALSLKLVDQLGNLDDAVELAGKLAGIEGKPSMHYPKEREPGLLELLSSAEGRNSVEQILSRRTPRFLYRW